MIPVGDDNPLLCGTFKIIDMYATKRQELYQLLSMAMIEPPCQRVDKVDVRLSFEQGGMNTRLNFTSTRCIYEVENIWQSLSTRVAWTDRRYQTWVVFIKPI